MTKTELKKTAMENYAKIYGFSNIEDSKFLDEFNACWNQLTEKEQYYFSFNCCMYYKNNEIKIYFHCFDDNRDCWSDIELDDFRKLLANKNRCRYMYVYDCIDGGLYSMN